MRRSFTILLVLSLISARLAVALTADQWKSDLSAFRQAIAAHPNAFVKISKEEFEQKANALAEELGGLNDSQVVARLAELAVLLGDGHTRLVMPVAENAQLFVSHGKTPRPKLQPFGSFPVRLARTAEGLVVTRTTEQQQDLLGAVVEAIQEKPTTTVEAEMRPLVHGDNEHQRDYLLPQFLVIPELLTAMNVTPEPANVSWTFRLPDGKQVSRRLSDIGSVPVKWSLLSRSAFPPEKQHSFRKLEDGLISARLTAILNDQQESVAQFADSLFAEIESTPNATLSLDLRDNQGGDNTLNDAIVRAAIRSRKVWEPGRFFVLINGGTFSAAINLATLLERWTPVIFVGQQTGGSPNGYGDPKRTILPQSGLSLPVSTLYWQMSNPTDKRDCITPLLPVEPNADSLRSGRDLGTDLIQSLTKPPGSLERDFSGQLAVPNQQLELTFQFTKDAARVSIPKLRIAAQPVANFRRSGMTVEGHFAIGSQNVALRGRFTGPYFLGWLELSGRPYSFVAQTK